MGKENQKYSNSIQQQIFIESLQCAKQYSRFGRQRRTRFLKKDFDPEDPRDKWRCKKGECFLQHNEGVSTAQMRRKSSESRERHLIFLRATRDSSSEDIYQLGILKDRLARQTSGVCNISSSISRHSMLQACQADMGLNQASRMPVPDKEPWSVSVF